MQNTIKTLVQMIQAATPESSPIHQTAEQIANIAEKESDQEQIVQAIAQLAIQICNQDRDRAEITPESEERAYAFHLCHALIGLCKYAVQEAGIIQYPASWPGKPLFHLGQFVETQSGVVEGIARDGASWFYYLHGIGWFKEDDLLLQEELEPVKDGKLDNEPTTPYKDDYDPFLDENDLP